jgi:hypothetical protein
MQDKEGKVEHIYLLKIMCEYMGMNKISTNLNVYALFWGMVGWVELEGRRIHRVSQRPPVPPAQVEAKPYHNQAYMSTKVYIYIYI